MTVSEFRIKNPGTAPVATKLEIILKYPGGQATLVSVGGDGSFQLPANLDLNAGSLALFAVGPGFPRGSWQFNSRLTHPSTGAILSEDVNPFTIQ